ncbi:MAG: L-rhamnose mutarotase [Lentisphaeria bacterium]|nr:L-rhamnose mutarotase [Lentisphaeria bacterium]
MIRKAFYMEVRPERLEEYTRAHNPIPQELEAVMKRHGIHNYSIYHHPGTNVMFGYMEIESEEEFAKVADYECAHKWWKQMTENLVCEYPGAPKAKEEPMNEVFHMD